MSTCGNFNWTVKEFYYKDNFNFANVNHSNRKIVIIGLVVGAILLAITIALITEGIIILLCYKKRNKIIAGIKAYCCYIKKRNTGQDQTLLVTQKKKEEEAGGKGEGEEG